MRIRGYQNFVWPYLFIIAAHPGSAEYHSVDVTYPQQNIYTSLKTPDEGGWLQGAPQAPPRRFWADRKMRARQGVAPAGTGKSYRQFPEPGHPGAALCPAHLSPT